VPELGRRLSEGSESNSVILRHVNEQKLAKFRSLTLKYDLLTLKMTSDAVENDTTELAILKTPILIPRSYHL